MLGSAVLSGPSHLGKLAAAQLPNQQQNRQKNREDHFFFGRRPLPFGGSHLRLPSGPAGIRTTTGSLSALARQKNTKNKKTNKKQKQKNREDQTKNTRQNKTNKHNKRPKQRGNKQQTKTHKGSETGKGSQRTKKDEGGRDNACFGEEFAAMANGH